MIKIAICDDETQVCGDLESHVLQAADEKGIKADVDVFYSAISMVDHLKKDHSYDIMFLDIEMEGLDGIELSKYIRNELEDFETKIIFISWKKGYAMNLFEVRPYHFLIKPIDDNLVEIGKIISDIHTAIIAKKKYFIYKSGKYQKRCILEDIYYFQSVNREVEIHFKDNNDTTYKKLDAIEKDIDTDSFLRIHKSYLVNVNLVNKFGYEEVILENGESIDISQSYRKSVRDYKLNNWGKNR